MSLFTDSARLAPLHEIAHAHAGDKGNRSSISLIPYRRSAFSLLLEQVTEDRVLAHFQYRGVSNVRRYVLPRLPALNFVLDDVLEGGVNRSLGLDGHGQSLSFYLLGLSIRVPSGSSA
jgi:hypothetical protein